MSTKHAEFWGQLAAPFPGGEVKTLTKGGRSFKFINGRQVMIRLDEVCGPENWEFSVKPWGSDLIGTLTITLPDGTKVSKTDVGGRAGMNDPENDAKSASSDALKRCGAMFGIARELYGDGTADLTGEGRDHQQAAAPAPRGGSTWGNTADRGEAARRPSHDGGERKPYDGPDRAPTSGRALFAWTKKMEEQHDVGLLKYLNSWSRLQEFPQKMVDWDSEQVALAYAEGTKRLANAGVPAEAEEATAY